MELSQYTNQRERSERLKALANLRSLGEFLPLSLAEDLLVMDLSSEEKLAILETAGSRDGCAYEHFLTENLLTWSQELSALSVKMWSHKTDHLLWYRFLNVSRSPHATQRVCYTILDNAWTTGGQRLVSALASIDDLAGMSPAFHGLMLHRALQWNCKEASLNELASLTLSGLDTHLHPDNKALPSALAYLCSNNVEHLQKLVNKTELSEPWRDLIRAMLSHSEQFDKQFAALEKLLAKPPKTGAAAKLAKLWPPLWLRSNLKAEMVASALAIITEKEMPAQANYHSTLVSNPWEFFAGIPAATLEHALDLQTSDAAVCKSIMLLGGLLSTPTPKHLLSNIKTRISTSESPGEFLSHLPLKIRLELTTGDEKSASLQTNFARVKQEEEAALNQNTQPLEVFSDYKQVKNGQVTYLETSQENISELSERKHFFDLAYREIKTPQNPVAKQNKTQNDFWQHVSHAWASADEGVLNPLATAARQIDGVFRFCYINTLGRFKGNDQAALKTLDFIRSKEHDDLRTVIQALDGIGTPRAMQELVALLTRPNVTSALKLEICAVLQKQNLSNLQSELRSAIQDFSIEHNGAQADWEVREAISALLLPASSHNERKSSASEASPQLSSFNDQQLDQLLGGKIQNYRELSSEVKRALRTSQFFHLQVSGSQAPESIDLSPVIDMQYKALELLFRETFEEPCARLIHRGILQRRLDILGYARPIPRAMDEFENYINSLPTVREIPFFSKFKLRKMLRAICQYRPGRRFTLDGLKAFALFFLCFSRNECRYGLQNLFPVGYQSDHDLYNFVRALHIFQDFRNRAAHEGFHPDASNDIDGIWRATAEITQNLFKIKAHLESAPLEEYAPQSKSNPIIQKKVS